jgi:hypothetical protein
MWACQSRKAHQFGDLVRASVCAGNEHNDGFGEEEGAEFPRTAEAGRELARELDVVRKLTEHLERDLFETLHLCRAREQRGKYRHRQTS